MSDDHKKLTEEELEVLANLVLTRAGNVPDKTTPRKTSPFVYVWLGFSIALNITGLSSLVEGFVTWSNFAAAILDVYHAFVRAPVLSVLNLVIPDFLGPVPTWVADVITIYASLLSACSAMFVLELRNNDTVWSLFDRATPLLSVTAIIAYPVMLLLLIFDDDAFWRRWSRRYYRYILTMMFLFTMWLFMNYQLAVRDM